MKHPWITFSSICTLVLGIVLFCVVFGGYSSLLRSQNRINTVKQMLTEQCTGQVQLAKQLAEIDITGKSTDQVAELKEYARKLNTILIRMAASKDPLEPQLIREFEAAQAGVSRSIEAMLHGLKADQSRPETKLNSMERRQAEIETSVLVMVRQYNKEARYFNTRSRQFPGAVIARLFSLDHLLFPEISPPLPRQGDPASAS